MMTASMPPGLIALAGLFNRFGTVAVVAPDRERSAIGHALTLHHPLRAMKTRHRTCLPWMAHPQIA